MKHYFAYLFDVPTEPSRYSVNAHWFLPVFFILLGLVGFWWSREQPHKDAPYGAGWASEGQFLVILSISMLVPLIAVFLFIALFPHK